MTNKSVASSLKETAALIDLTGGNPFRSRSMMNAARTIERLEDPVGELVEAGTLTNIRGIGAGLAAQIAQLLATGSFDVREELLGSIPPGLLDMLAVKGLGAKKVRALWQTLGIQTLDELETAAGTGVIRSLEGFGARSEATILENVAALRQYRTQRHFADAYTRAEALVMEIRELPGVEKAETAGELRRGMEVVSSVEIVVGLQEDAPRDALTGRFAGTTGSAPGGSNRIESTTEDGLPLTLHVTETSAFGSVFFERTGSETFVDAWKARFAVGDANESEHSVFEEAGVEFIDPELREEAAVIDSAVRRDLPCLIEDGDLKGTLHNHSTYSDGAHSLSEMAESARAMGLSYFGICDHSQSLQIAHGLSPEEVERQWSEIETLNRAFSRDAGPEFRIFSGIESDILADGKLDYPEEILSGFDFVVASVHTGFNMSESQATERVIRAVENPHTSILGHPTGRLLLRRKGYPLDHEAVLDACARCGVAVELNANPYRLDLDWRWIRSATERGILISINPDAHATEQLRYTRWGVSVARKGFLTADMCLNALDLDGFGAWLEARKAKKGC